MQPELRGSLATFPFVLHEGAPLRPDHLDSYLAAFYPMLTDLETAQADEEREMTYHLQPVFFLDYSELFHLWSSRRTLAGRTGTLDWQDALVANVLEDSTFALYLPAGTLLEIAHHLVKDCNIQLLSDKAQELASNPESGLVQLPELDDLVAELPSPDKVVRAVERASHGQRTQGYRDLANKLRSGRLRLLHGETFARAPWQHQVFKEALDYLNIKRPPSSKNNLWDALNIAITMSINQRYTQHRHVGYLVGRGKLHDTAEIVPWRSDPVARFLGHETHGVARSPVYLFLRSWFAQQRKGSLRYLSLMDLTADLKRVANLLHALVGLRTDQPEDLVLSTELDLQFRASVNAFNEKHAHDAKSLYFAWEAYRRVGPRYHIPSLALRDEDARSTARAFQKSVETILGAAEDARLQLRGQVAGEPSQLEERICVQEQHENIDGTDEHSYGLLTERDSRLVLQLEFLSDYYTACWYSNADIHSFLDWIDTYVSELAWIENKRHLKLHRARPTNNMFVAILRTSASHEEDPNEESESDEDTETLRSVPFSREDRADIVRSVGGGGVEALRIYTAYGDAWLNLVHSRDGRIRAGLLSHICAPAFLARFVALTIDENLSVKSLHREIRSLMERHLPSSLG